MSDISTYGAFDYDNRVDIDDGHGEYGGIFPHEYNLVAVIDGKYYAISSPYKYKYDDSCFYGTGTMCYYDYNASSGQWVSHQGGLGQLKDLFPVSISSVKSQNVDPLLSNYYTSEQFQSGRVYAPMGSYADAIYTEDAFSGIFAVLPVLLSVLIGLVAVRKGISFLISRLKGG